MARPPTLRRVVLGFESQVFKPVGVPLFKLEVVQLALDGLEALRLADLEGLYQEAAAERMGVSRATFGRILAEARSRVAEALVGGKALRVGGGPVVEGEPVEPSCPLHWGGRRRGRGCRCRGQWADARSVESGGGTPAPPEGGDGEDRQE